MLEHTAQTELVFTAVPAELAGRIAVARVSASWRAQLVLRALTVPGAERIGSKNAMSIDSIQQFMQKVLADLAAKQGCVSRKVPDERAIKAAVKELLEEHSIPIGAIRQQPNPGYYLIVSDEDARLAERPLLAEVKSLLKRLKTISPKTDYMRHLQGQQELQTAEGAK